MLEAGGEDQVEPAGEQLVGSHTSVLALGLSRDEGVRGCGEPALQSEAHRHAYAELDTPRPSRHVRTVSFTAWTATPCAHFRRR
jgi:hypothetical protein